MANDGLSNHIKRMSWLQSVAVNYQEIIKLNEFKLLSERDNKGAREKKTHKTRCRIVSKLY